MDLETRLSNLENLVDALSKKIDRNQFYSDADINGNRQSISNITPYTETKTAYYGDTECVFYDAPEGNITVFGDIGEYTPNRLANRLYVYFKPLGKQTDITISIS